MNEKMNEEIPTVDSVVPVNEEDKVVTTNEMPTFDPVASVTTEVNNNEVTVTDSVANVNEEVPAVSSNYEVPTVESVSAVTNELPNVDSTASTTFEVATPENNPVTESDIKKSENIKIVTNANSPTNIDDIKIDTVTIDANSKITAKEYVEEEKYKITGTVNEEDLKTVNTKPIEEEVLDEHAIKRDVQMSDADFKKKILYIVAFVGVIVLFMLFLPIIFKIFGM